MTNDELDIACEEILGMLVRRKPGKVVPPLPGLGGLRVQGFPAYEGRNPRTGEPVAVAAKKIPFFLIAPDARDRLTGGPPTTGAFASVVEAACADRSTVLGPLGVLRPTEKPGRPGFNPDSDAPIVIPAIMVLVLRASVTLARALAGQRPHAIGTAELAPWFATAASHADLVSLAGDRVLAPADVRRVLAHFGTTAPGSLDSERELPY